MADTDYGSLMDSAATPQPQGTQDSGYGALMDDETKAQATLAVASGASIPQDRAVQNAILAKRYHTSPAVVDAYPDDFRRQALLEDTRNQLAVAPKLASTIAQNPHAVDLVQGQIGQLAQMEQALQPRGLIPDIWAGLQHTGTKVLGAWDKGAVALDQWIQQNLPWLHENVPGFMSPEEQQAYQSRGKFLQQRANWEENMPQRWTGNVTSVVPYLFFGGAAPAVMGGTEGSATTQNLEDQGVDEQTAQRAGAAEGALTALTAMLPMGKLRWGEGAMPLAKSFLAGSAKAGGVGAVQSVSTDEAVKAILDSAGYTDLAQQYSPTLSKAADSALFMAAFHLGSEGGQRLMMGHLADLVRANKAQNDAQRLETISQISQQATLRQGDPELFKQTVQSMAEDGDLHTVYVDGRTFQQSLDKNGISEEELKGLLPDVARQLPEALQTKGDISIPVEDYATHLAGSKLDAELLPQLKTSPDGMTLNESRVFQEQQADRMKQDAVDLVKNKDEAAGFRQSQEKVEGNIKAQLDALNRFPPDVNRIYAKVQAAILSRMAAREGMSPEEAYTTYGSAVRGEPPPASAEGLEGSAMGQGVVGAIKDIAVKADIAANRVIGGEPGETLSARAGREKDNSKVARAAAATLDAIVPGHTDRAQIATAARQRAMGLFQEGGDPLYNNAVSHTGQRGAVSVSHLVRQYGIKWDRADALVKRMEADGYITPKAPEEGSVVTKDAQGNWTTKQGITNKHLGQYDATDKAKSFLYQENGKADAERAQNAAEPRGFYSTLDRSVSLLKNANLSTYLHETGHWALDMYSNLAADALAHPEIRADMDQILKWFGVKDIDTWNKMSLSEQRPYHEQFARGFESYLMEGKAPSMELRPAFQRIRAWMTSIYHSLKNLNVELTPEVRGVFDRMLASDEAIKDAEVARGYMLPEVKPENISGADWETLTKLQAQAHADAVDELQTKSVRDMQWLSNLKGKKVRELNREAAEQRKGVQAEVEKQVDQMPVYKAEKWLKTGETTAEDGEEVKALKGFKLNTDDVRRMLETLPEDQRIAPADLKGLTSPEGLHPDMVAEMFGFSSGEKLLTELVGREPRESVVEGMTDQKMLEEHGELSSPQAINEAANAAVANAARTRFTATLMRVMAKSPIPTRTLVNGAKEAADAAIGQKKVGDLRPAQYDRQEAQANKKRMRLMATDPAGAFDAQRAALLNGQLGIAAREAQAEMQDLLKVQAKYDKKSIRTKMDPDILDQIDALRDRFDFRKNPTPDKKVQQLSQWVDSQKALGYSPVESEDMLNPAVRTHYSDMTVDQMRGLLATLKSMEKLARGRRTLTVEGQQRDLQEVVAEMNEKMKARGEKFTDAQLAEKPRRGIDPAWRVALDRTEAWLRGAGADMKAQHFKANQYDLHQIMGPFHRYLFEPVFDANYKFLDLRREVSNDFREAAKKLGGREWQHSLMDVVENHNLMDNSLETPTKRRLTRGDLIGMALHVGNESNFDKLAQGMGWKPEDIWRALHDNMRKEDWEAARVLGEASGKHWDDQVQMNRNMGNTMPEKIQPRPFMTKFGEMPGWYAPVRYDPIRSRLAKKQAAARAVNPAEGLFSKTYYRADTTTNGSLNARVAGYHDFIDLDWHATEQAIHDSLRDLAYREALVNAHKVWANNDFRRQFMRTYGPEAYDSLGEWLGRIVNNEAGDERTNRFVHFMAATRRAVVASGIALRISTMLKHGGSAGIKSMGYFAGGGEKYFLARVKGIALAHGAQVAEALAKFPEIRARAEQQDRDFNQTISSLMEPESVHAKAERFGHAGVATLDFLTAVPTAHAAYDWATTEGIPKRLGGTGQPMSHADAVKFASSMVREAHGTNIESGRSNLINTRSELLKTLTVLHGFMNNAWGQNLDAIDKMHMKEFGKPEIAARYLMAMIVPGLVVGAVTEGLPDKQKEGWAHWTASAIGGEYAATVPLLRDMYAQVAKGYHEAGLPPFFKAFAQLAKPVEDVKNAAQGKEVKAPVKDAANAGGLLLPGLSQIGATSQFLIDEHTGKQKAETVGDWMRGLMTGTAKKHD